MRAAALSAAFFLFFQQAPLNAALRTKQEIPEFLGIREWKSQYGPLKKKNILGAVVLIHFSSFTDVRSLYKADTLINWQNKYYVSGFRVIHMLTPDFTFEKEITLPQHLSQNKLINYPIAMDYRKAQWQAYNNPEKPFDFLIDKRGQIRFKVPAGESFENEEKMIQLLLKEADPSFWSELEQYPIPKIPEIQDFPLGYRRNLRLGNLGKARSETRQNFKLPAAEPTENLIYLSGYWKIWEEFAETAQGGAELRLVWDGSPLFILGGIDRDSPTPVQIKIDEDAEIPEKLKGPDVVKQAEGYYIFLQKTQIYQASRLLKGGKHTLVLSFPEAGAKIFKISVSRKK